MTLKLLSEILAAYDPELVDRTISPAETMTGRNYFPVGESAAAIIMTAVAASKLETVATVLDLPCGHGRVLRHLVRLFPGALFDVCDTDAAGSQFCATHFGARELRSSEDLTQMEFDRQYDLIWIGSLFTHTSERLTREWLAFLAKRLSHNGIIIATFHGRWPIYRHQVRPYVDEARWTEIVAGYTHNGYGYADYHAREEGYIRGSFGISVARPSKIMEIAEAIPDVRIFFYQELGWADHQDVIAFGRPGWQSGHDPKFMNTH